MRNKQKNKTFGRCYPENSVDEEGEEGDTFWV